MQFGRGDCDQDQGIDTRPTNTWRRRIDDDEEGNAQAGPSTTPTRPAASTSTTPARASRVSGVSGTTKARVAHDRLFQTTSGYASDNLDDSDGETPNKKKKQTKADLAKEKAKAKAKADAAKKRKRDEADFEDDEDEEDEYTAPSKTPVKLKMPDVGSIDNCAECSKKFTVVRTVHIPHVQPSLIDLAYHPYRRSTRYLETRLPASYATLVRKLRALTPSRSFQLQSVGKPLARREKWSTLRAARQSRV